MGNVLMQSLVVMCNATQVAENTEQSGGQFPFWAALILIVIIMVVSIGDMVHVNKSKETDEKSNHKDEKPNSSL